MGETRVGLLIVEDDLPLTRLWAAELGELAEATFAPTLQQARDKLANGAFDAVLLDLRLPDGNGIDLLREITARGDDLPVIVLTADADPESANQALRCGAYDTLSKPCHLADLQRRLRHIAHHRQLQRENLALRQQLRSLTELTTLQDMEWRMIQEALRVHGGNKTAAAKALGISLRTLYNKLDANSTPPPPKPPNPPQ